MKSSRLGVIFIHIPKCGGTSVEKMLFSPDEFIEENFWKGDRNFKYPSRGKLLNFVAVAASKVARAAGGPMPRSNIYQTGGLQHLTALQIRHAMGRRKFEDFYKFSTVRNPLHRSMSQYKYMRNRPDLRSWIGMHAEDSFEKYLIKTYSRHHVQWQPQISFLYDYRGNCLVDKILKLEEIQMGMEEVLDKLGMEPQSVPHFKKSELRSEIHVSEYAKDIVWELYKEDFEVFGYEMTNAY